jgi:hypothetical protein
MRQAIPQKVGSPESGLHESAIDVVVPYTTPELTRVAIQAAEQMGGDLNAGLRFVRIQIVPAQMDICQSPVAVSFLREQLAALRPDLEAARELRFARDFTEGLAGTLTKDSVVILAAPRRPWKTRNERLATTLRRRGYRVIVVANNGKSREKDA